MKKTLLIIPLFALILALPAACAGSFHMDVSGSGNISFYSYHSSGSGFICQDYTGSNDGIVDYESTYSDDTLETDIDATGSGSFGTIIIPTNSWSADAAYIEDGSPVSDFGSGTTIAIFPHSWSSSFNGGGLYSLN